MVDQLHPLGQLRDLPYRCFQPLHALHPGLIVVQAQTQVGDMGMIAKKLEHGAGRGAAQRQVVAVPRPPQTGKPGAARGVPAPKYTVLIFPAFIERTSLDTRLQQLRMDAPGLQIGQHGGREPAGLRECKGLRRFWFGPFLGQRGAGGFQAVMGPGAVFIGTAPLQLMGVKGLKVGKKIPLLRLFDLLLGHT